MKKIVIIGGGVAGLAAGIYALKNGFSAEIIEKHAVAGGQCTGWKRQGMNIDNCIHWSPLTYTRYYEFMAWLVYEFQYYAKIQNQLVYG